jgi:hypothetical protein
MAAALKKVAKRDTGMSIDPDIQLAGDEEAGGAAAIGAGQLAAGVPEAAAAAGAPIGAAAARPQRMTGLSRKDQEA